MLVHYFNDEKHAISVRILDSRYDPSTAKGDFFFRLEPAQDKTFEVLLPEDSFLWVKKWPGIVMLSFCSVSALEHLGPILPEQQHRLQPGEES